MSNRYTIILTEEQKQVLHKAMQKFSELYLGQVAAEHEIAKKLEPQLGRLFKDVTNDLTQAK